MYPTLLSSLGRSSEELFKQNERDDDDEYVIEVFNREGHIFGEHL